MLKKKVLGVNRLFLKKYDLLVWIVSQSYPIDFKYNSNLKVPERHILMIGLSVYLFLAQ